MDSVSRVQVLTKAVCIHFILMPLEKAWIHSKIVGQVGHAVQLQESVEL